jgi:uncharacterized protein YndB with AHSA1/START domain
MADIRHSIQIAAKPEEVFPLVATAKGLSAWWAADVTEPGGTVDLGFFNRSTVYRLRLAASDASSEADWRCENGAEWNGTRIAFRLKAGGPGTVLQFVHGQWQAETDYFVSCTTTWGELMFRLKAAAEGKKRGPLFPVNGMDD